MENEYNINSIKALDDISHIRLRPALYIGDLSNPDHLIKEVVDNSIDEFLAGFGNAIDVHIYKDGAVCIRDYGRGIPVGIVKDKNNNDINSLTLIVGSLNSGSKYNNDIYQYSAGIHGQGTCCVNALSEFFKVTVYRDGKIYQQQFERGKPITDVTTNIADKANTTGTEIYYKPDKKIFKQTIIPSNEIYDRLQELAALNPGLTINFVNDLNKINIQFCYENGIKSYITELVENKKVLFTDPIYISENNIEISFLINKELESLSFIKAYCNNIHNYAGGTHVDITLKTLVNCFNNFGIKHKLFKTPIEQKYYIENLYLIVSVKMQNPSFEGQTKIKLNSIEIEPIIAEVINNFFKRKLKEEDFKQLVLQILNYIIQIKEADEAAKKARIEKRITNKVTKKQLLPVQLADCINAGTNQYAEVILVEGQSSSGCVNGNTLIHLADNRDVPIKQLVQEHSEGKKNYVFCCDEQNNIHVQLIKNAFRTRFATKLIRITLDNGMTLEATPDHLIMMRDGSFVPIKDLIPGDSLMPLYIRYLYRQRKWFGDYFTPQIRSEKKYINIADITARDHIVKPDDRSKYNLHHIDYDPCNNNPENLIYLTPQEHSQRHATEQKYWSDPEIKERISQKSKEMWQDPEYRKKMDFVFHADTNPLIIAHRKHIQEDEEYRQRVINPITKYHEDNPNWREHLAQKMNEFYDINTQEGRGHRKAASDKSKKQWEDEELRKWRAEETRKQFKKQKEDGTLQQIIDKKAQTMRNNIRRNMVNLLKYMIANNIAITKQNYEQQRKQYAQANNISQIRMPTWNYTRQIISFNEKKDDVEKIVREYVETYNHCVKKVEEMDYNDYVYDLEVDKYHNFAISAGIFIHNSAIRGRVSPEFQAVLPLRGKILNVEKTSWEQIAESQSVQRIIQTLGTGFGKNFDINKLRYNKIIILCFKGDTKVKMLDGTIKTFEELVEMEKQNPDQTYWVYSCKPDGTIVPGAMKHPRITQYVQDTIKITLDDGGFLETTVDHRFMLRDGTYCEARNLKVGDSLMPLYTRTNSSWSAGREELYNNNLSSWQRTHRVVMEYFDDGSHSGRNWHVHHINRNFLDNRPNNMEWQAIADHMKEHSDHIIAYNQSQAHRDRVKQLHQDGIYQHTYWGNNGYNGSEAQKKMLKELNQREDIQAIHSKTMTAYNKTEQNREATRRINQREDVKLLQKQGKIVHNVACLIRKNVAFNEQSFQDKKQIALLKQYLVNVPTLAKINEVFSSFDEMLQKAINYEKNELTDEMFKQLTNVEEANKNRVAANLNTKRNSMAKLGKKIFDQNLPFNEQSYQIVKKQTGSKAPRWENITDYFSSIDEFKEYSKNYNHKVVNIEYVHYDQPIPMYCGTVETHHNFAVVTNANANATSGVFVRNCDADIDGLHISSLIITLIYNFMRQLITDGHLYVAIPPLYKVIYNKDQSLYLKDDEALQKWKEKNPNINFELQRFKGLGEMDADQLRETVLDPAKRMLKQINIKDALKAQEAIKICMGTDTKARRNFIENNAYLVTDLNG